MKTIDECIQMKYEYPAEEIMDKGLIDNCVYGYVNSSFCNGIVNWLDNKEMYMLCRYYFGKEDIDYVGCTYIVGDISKDPNYKQYLDIIEKINNIPDKDWFHTNFDNLKIKTDDIIVTGDTYKSYWAIWFDNDISDCFIYKISKDNFSSLKDFNDAFVKHIQDSGTYISKIRNPEGWIKI